jgi:hypothetical protein
MQELIQSTDVDMQVKILIFLLIEFLTGLENGQYRDMINY